MRRLVRAKYWSVVPVAEVAQFSLAKMAVVTPRPIQSAPGAVSVEGRQAVYRWPLVRVLPLETPIRLTLKF